MRPGDFYELSRYLALRLEQAIQGGSGESLIPVFLAHPVDIPKAESRSEEHTSELQSQ